MMTFFQYIAFLTYRRMIELQKGISDVWWKVLLLMDIPFKTIEKTLSDYSGSLEEKINGVNNVLFISFPYCYHH